MQRKFTLLSLTTLLYAAGVVLFFAEGAALPYTIACPVLLLALSVFYLRREELIPVGIALLASSFGDAMGAKGLFLLQMLFFAWVHWAYIGYFLARAKPVFRVVPCLIPAVLLIGLFVFIAPCVSDPVERTGVVIYGFIIAGMLCAVLRYRGTYAAWFRTAALLFVLSDAVLAWNRFVSPVPGRTYVVMITYYLAQYLFYRFAVLTSVTKEA